MSKEKRLDQAIRLYREFTGMDPEFVDTVELPVHDTGMIIGQCDGVLYTTVRDGKRESYIHEFKKKARPILAVSSDGSQLYLLMGAYRFTDRGIVDET